LINERYKSWATLSAQPPKIQTPRPVFVIRNIQKFQNLENDILLELRVYGFLRGLLQEKIDSLSKEIFGIDENDTKFIFPKAFNDWEEYSPKRTQALESNERHEEKFETRNLSDKEAVTVLKSFGYDFCTENGAPLLLTVYFKRQVEAVYKKIAGHSPDLNELSLIKFQTKLEQEVLQFQKTRK
jgi:hypothetical protein